MPPTDPISQLREELERLSGPARITALGQLAQALEQRSWQAGWGLPQALPDLAEAIGHLSEIYGYLQPGDAMRGPVAAKLGVLLAGRQAAYGGDAASRETGIRVLRDALTFPNVPPILAAAANLCLAQLYMSRAIGGLPSAALTVPLIPADGAAIFSTDDLDRADACLRSVLDREPMNTEITTTAKTLLELTDTMRQFLASTQGGAFGMDLNRLTNLIAKMRDLQSRFGSGPYPDVKVLAMLDPLDRPTTVVQGMPQPPPDRPVRHQEPPAVVDRTRLRQSLQAKLRSAVKATDPLRAEPWVCAAESLLPSAEIPPPHLADDIVALASMVVEGPATEDPQTTGVDWFVLAAALRMRDRVDPGGGGDDRVSGCDCLLTAARTIPFDHPAAVAIFRSLGAFLDGARPRGGLPDPVAEGFADRIDSMIASGRVREPADLATLHALRCLCRADDLAAVQRAVGATPRDYPWIELVRAVEHNLRAAHRSG